MKRYDPITRFDQGGTTLGEMKECQDGEWVAFQDALQLIKEITDLKRGLENAGKIIAELAKSHECFMCHKTITGEPIIRGRNPRVFCSKYCLYNYCNGMDFT